MEFLMRKSIFCMVRTIYNNITKKVQRFKYKYVNIICLKKSCEIIIRKMLLPDKRLLGELFDCLILF